MPATVRQITTAFPTMSAKLVIRCASARMPMASVANIAIDEATAENARLKARLAALEKERDELEAAEDEKDTVSAQAKARSQRPVAFSSGGRYFTAQARFRDAVDANIASGMTRPKAVRHANRQNPGLRQAMLEEANTRR